MNSTSKKAQCDERGCDELSVWEGGIGNKESQRYCQKHVDSAIDRDIESRRARCNQGDCNELAVWGGDIGSQMYCEKHLTPETRKRYEKLLQIYLKNLKISKIVLMSVVQKRKSVKRKSLEKKDIPNRYYCQASDYILPSNHLRAHM